jgi:hypothetical protein
MALPVVEDTATAGHDSFLDIVANIVGILIILVMVAGVRVKNFSLDTAEPNELIKQAEKALQDDRALVDSVREDVFKISDQIEDVERETRLRQIERDRLATMVEAGRYNLETRRDQLDKASRAGFDLSSKIAEAELELEQVERRQSQLERTPARPTLVESYPTPLSKTVDEDEAHFQLRGERLVHIPLDRLVEEFKADARRKIYKLKDLPEFAETVGPEGGFRLRYTMERKTVTPEVAAATGLAGQYAQLQRWTLIPVSNDLGETVEEALAEGSKFQTELARLSSQTTITIWTYPDSFAGFRRLKEVLYGRGFRVAARPMPQGAPIAGSPEGTKSAAQ